MWAIAITVSLISPAILQFISRDDPEIEKERERSMHIRPSLVERFGLFTIIVLGEVVIAVVRGIAGHHNLETQTVIIAALITLLAMSMWWVYFDFISHRNPIKSVPKRLSWIYLHLPVTICIAMVGAGGLYAIEHTTEIASHWIFIDLFPYFSSALHSS